MYIDALALKYKIKFDIIQGNGWNTGMFVAGGLLSLAHRFEMVTTDCLTTFCTRPILHASYFHLPIIAMILVLSF